MRPSGLNTLIVQRVESALGVPLATHTQLATGARARQVGPTVAAVNVQGTESSTAKVDSFAQTLATRQAGQPMAPTRDLSAALRPQEPGAQSQAVARSETAAAPNPPSAKMNLSPIGRTLLPLLEGFPKGAGPLTHAQPLFISAVLTLRAQIASTAFANALPSDPGAKIPQATPPPAGASLFAAPTQNASQVALNPLSSPLTQALMVVLKGQIVQSGLFYESHLYKQLQRDLSKLETLKEEPQARHPLSKTSDVDVPEDLRPLVRQQLDLLAGQPIQWQGQIWPGATLRWEIVVPAPDEQSARAGAEGEEATESTCTTRLELELPHLGPVTARLRVSGSEVDVHLEVGDDGAILQERISTLRDTLAAAGMTPKSITIARAGGVDA